MVKKLLRICITVYTEYRRVTDGHTQTFCHGIVRAMHTRGAVKIGISHSKSCNSGGIIIRTYRNRLIRIIRVWFRSLAELDGTCV